MATPPNGRMTAVWRTIAIALGGTLLGLQGWILSQQGNLQRGQTELKVAVARLDPEAIERLSNDVSAALTVIADHGTELAAIRERIAHVELRQTNFEQRIFDELSDRTDDRFYRREWESKEKWLDEKFKAIDKALEERPSKWLIDKLDRLEKEIEGR